MMDQDIYSNSNDSEKNTSPNNKLAQNAISDNSVHPYYDTKISKCHGDVNDSGLGSSRIISKKRNTEEDRALPAAETDLNPQRGFMFYDLNDIETVVSEVKACERELSDVESKLLDLTEEIRNREAKIIDLEGKFKGQES